MSISDIEDNYPNYLEDTLGYSFEAWDLVQARDRTLHDRIMAANLSDVSSFEAKDLPGIALWALARRKSESLDSLDAFENLVLELVKLEDPCLDHLGIATFTMRLFIKLGQNDRAEHLLNRLEALQNEKELWLGLLKRDSDLEGSKATLGAWVDKDQRPIEAVLDIVENMIHFGDRDAAAFWLEEASKRAAASNSPAQVDIELLKTSIQNEG